MGRARGSLTAPPLAVVGDYCPGGGVAGSGLCGVLAASPGQGPESRHQREDTLHDAFPFILIKFGNEPVKGFPELRKAPEADLLEFYDLPDRGIPFE